MLKAKTEKERDKKENSTELKDLIVIIFLK